MVSQRNRTDAEAIQKNSRSEDKSGDNEILPRSSSEQMRRQYQEGVKPAPCLIDTLRDEVRREGILENFLVFKRVMNLSVGHTTRALQMLIQTRLW
jgi:hypothetical protein